jgi:ribosomal protein S27E
MTETDFITLACPSCGGKRTVKPGTTSVKCEYCGNEYLSNPRAGGGFLEMASQCPICHRNDRVEKVSSIIAHQIQHIQGTTLQNQTVVDHEGKVQTQIMPTPYNATQATVLAQNLNHPPVEPHIPSISLNPPQPFDIEAYIKQGKSIKNICAGIGGVSIVIGVIAFLASGFSSDGLIAFFWLLAIGALIGVPGWFIGRAHQTIKDHPGEIKRLEHKQQAALDAYHRTLEEKERILTQYQKECQNWDHLYYCYRDDCIFVPGKGHAAPVNELDSYLDIA